jgi:hypothetical protein
MSERGESLEPGDEPEGAVEQEEHRGFRVDRSYEL